MTKTMYQEKIELEDILKFTENILKFCQDCDISYSVAMLSCILLSEFLKDYLNVPQIEFDNSRRALSKIVKDGVISKP